MSAVRWQIFPLGIKSTPRKKEKTARMATLLNSFQTISFPPFFFHPSISHIRIFSTSFFSLLSHSSQNAPFLLRPNLSWVIYVNNYVYVQKHGSEGVVISTSLDIKYHYHFVRWSGHCYVPLVLGNIHCFSYFWCECAEIVRKNNNDNYNID